MLADLLISAAGSLAVIVIRRQIAVPSISDAAILIGLFVAISGALTALVTAINAYRGSKAFTDQLDLIRAELKETKEKLDDTNKRLDGVRQELERADSALAYISSSLVAQHAAEINYALAIRRGDEDAPSTPVKNGGRDSDPALRQKRRRGPQ